MNITAPSRIAVAAAILALTVAAPTKAVAQYGYAGTDAASVRVPKAVLERYEGEWVYPDGNSVMVRLRGETLYREIPGQQVAFVPISHTVFRLGPVFTAEFVVDKAGGITQILSDGAAVEFRLQRKGSRPAATPAPPPAVRVPTSVLERYAGHYEYLPGQMSRTDLFVDVHLRGDTLSGPGTGQGPVVLTPISETRFQVGSTAIVWEFVVDQKGGVTLVMGSGFQQMKARLVKP